jgi:uncharacterized protein YecT (DUF1311 family)
MKKHAIFLAVSFFSAAICSAASTTTYETQTEMNQRSCSELERANKDLDAAYEAVLQARGADPIFVRKFKRSEQVWELFRETQMDAIYPERDKEIAYGSIYPACRCALMTEMTVERIGQIKRFIDMAEGTACGY